MSEAEVLHIVRLACDEGYEFALDFIAQNYPQLSTYIASSLRADWIFHCYATGDNCSCLDLGSGLGSLSFLLARFFDETVSVEWSTPRLRFQTIRKKQQNTGNLCFARADMLSLPFKDESFDLVAANGVLEWAALMRGGQPRMVQVKFLREILRCLKRGGCLYIGIENRFGLQYWLGARDNTSIRFTSLLPRRISDVIVTKVLRDKGWKKYETYTYSYKGYASLLRDAGFAFARIYWTYPTHNYPKFAGRIDDGESFKFFLEYHSRLDKSLLINTLSAVGGRMPAYVLRRLCPAVWPSYSIFAWKERESNTIESELARLLHASSNIRISGDGRHVSFVTIAKRPEFYTQLPRFPGTSNENEQQLLRIYDNIIPTKHSIGKFDAFTQKRIDGRPCRVHNIRDCELAIEWLLKFQQRTSLKPFSQCDADEEQQEMSLHLAKIGIDSSYALEKTNEFMKSLVTRKVSMCAEHGDFFPDNIILKSTSEVIVIDWELFKQCGNPFYDFIFFMINIASLPDFATHAFLANISGYGPRSQVIKRIVEMYATAKKIPAESILLGIPYVILRCIVRYSMYSESVDPALSQRFRQLLRSITMSYTTKFREL